MTNSKVETRTNAGTVILRAFWNVPSPSELESPAMKSNANVLPVPQGSLAFPEGGSHNRSASILDLRH
jgi:hypothetical protein